MNVDGEEVEPGSNGLFDLASASNDIPVPLLVALIAIGLLAIWAAWWPCANACRPWRASRSCPRSRVFRSPDSDASAEQPRRAAR